ncbi:MAG: hypothetical protein CMM99_01710 [Rickettsiales bacterium]|nr:hypothetical protein [Rickettsiales bacterium]
MNKKILNLITGFKKSDVFFIIFLVFIGSTFEILSLGIVIPLISVFAENPENSILAIYLTKIFDKSFNSNEVILILSTLILTIFLTRFIFLSFLTTKINLFIFTCQKLISEKLLKIFMSKNFNWHSENNKSYFINLMTTEVFNFCQNGLSGFLFLCSELIFFLSIVVFLVFWEPKIFFLIMFISLIFFPVLIKFTKKVSYSLGVTRQQMESNILISINESLNGIKEMILYKWSKPVKEKFSLLASKLVKVSAKHNSFQDISRYLIELFGVILVVIFIYFLTASNKESNLITIGIFGAALFRLMPILNRISTYSQRLKYGMASTNKIDEFYRDNKNKLDEFENIEFLNDLILNNIYFKFNNKDKFVLENINLKIKSNEVIGISGESGSGKTTLSNIIMGLITPSSGEIIVDGKKIINEKLSIQKNIAFVPQNFFHMDSNILDNITFFDKKVKIKNLKFALKNSLLLDSILNKTLSLKTHLGNNALKISGGQLQRISIARAIYRMPKILILDEPTSALDQKNQDLFSQIILNLRKKITIIIISHNKNLLQNCDKVYSLESKTLKEIEK